MSHSPSVVAAFCTRNRPDELLRGCASLAESARASGRQLAGVLIVDGGALTSEQTEAVHRTLEGSAGRVERVDAASPAPSLYRSRLIALRRARDAGADYVAFFDDDVELEPDYIGRLHAALARESYAGLGGVDVLQARPSHAERIWRRFTGTAASRAGRRARSGLVESQWLWAEHAKVFESEYLSGCNMTLRVDVQDRLPADAESHFVTYSLGEDLVLAAAARRAGVVAIDPRLRVRHHQSAAGREGRFETGRQLVSNHVWMTRRGIGASSRTALGWALGWLFLRAVAGDALAGVPRGKAAGMLAGFREAQSVRATAAVSRSSSSRK